jgi:hypothetical protein
MAPLFRLMRRRSPESTLPNGPRNQSFGQEVRRQDGMANMYCKRRKVDLVTAVSGPLHARAAQCTPGTPLAGDTNALYPNVSGAIADT